MVSYTGEEKKRYYRKIEEIWELDYIGEKLPMFHVRWVIHLKRIYNFLCSMLVYTPFA
jgi:hypothetical protein